MSGTPHWQYGSDPYAFMAVNILIQAMDDWRKYGNQQPTFPLTTAHYALRKILRQNGYYDLKLELNTFLNSRWCESLCDIIGIGRDQFRRYTPELPWQI